MKRQSSGGYTVTPPTNGVEVWIDRNPAGRTRACADDNCRIVILGLARYVAAHYPGAADPEVYCMDCGIDRGYVKAA